MTSSIQLFLLELKVADGGPVGFLGAELQVPAYETAPHDADERFMTKSVSGIINEMEASDLLR